MRELDPKDPWSYLVPLTTKELSEERRRSVKSIRDEGYLNAAKKASKPGGFACDGCSCAPTCTLAYDAMNVGDDCLMDK